MNDRRATVFWTEQDSWTYGLTVVVMALTRPVEAQARENPRVEMEGGHEVSPLAEALWAVNGS